MTWVLRDITRNKSDRDNAPSARVRASLSPGNVALIEVLKMPPTGSTIVAIHHRNTPFRPTISSERCDGERLWVSIIETRDDNALLHYRGQVESVPVVFDGVIRKGEIVDFGPQHVLDWEPA